MKIPINNEVALRLDSAANWGLQLHTLWDCLPANFKYAVMFDDYRTRPDVKKLVDKLYSIQLAFAVKAKGESDFRVSTSIQLETDEFSFVMIACSAPYYRALFGHMDIIVEARVAIESLEAILRSD